MCIEKYSRKYANQLYVIARLLVGIMFFFHGAQKLLGWFGGPKVDTLASLMGVAGIVESAAGIALILGLWVRLAALVSAVQMIVAYGYAHVPVGWNPLANRGELALLYAAVFLLLVIHGNGKWSLEKRLTGKEWF